MSSSQQRRSAIAEQPIGADRELALLHTPKHARDAIAALFAIDAAMADVVARATDPNLARIKLAWWREQLEGLDAGAPPAEPRLQSVAEHLLSRDIGGAEPAKLEAGWATLLDEEIEPKRVAERGAILFGLGGQLLRSGDERLRDAGELYALASVARRGIPELLEPAKAVLGGLRRHRFARPLRPLTMLAAAAARDLRCDEPEGGRARVFAMLVHRWTGRIG